MFYKLFWLGIIISFINYTFMGCATVNKKRLYEINPHDRIKKITIPDGQQIKFDSRGGFLVQVEKAGIAGRTVKGYWVFLQLEDIKEIHKTSPPITRSIKQLRNQKIIELVSNENILVRFDSTGGRYDDSDYTIKGVKKNGVEETYQLRFTKGARIILPDNISIDSLLETKDQFIAEILTSDQRLIIFDKHGGFYVEPSNVVVGYTPKGSLVKLNRDQIDIGYVNQPPEPEIILFISFFGGPLLLITFASLLYSD